VYDVMLSEDALIVLTRVCTYSLLSAFSF
jgi:hypothetical protein